MKNKKNQEFLLNDLEKKKRKSKKFKQVTISIIIIIVASYSLYAVFNLVKNPSDTFIVSNGSLSKEEDQIGYVVRNETVIDKGDNNKQIVKIKQDNERVAKGDSVFRYYSQKEDELEQKIADIDKEMQEILTNNDTTFSSDKKLLETQIENQLNELYGTNKYQQIQEYKKNINTYITKKAKIIGDLSPSGSYLKKLIEKRETYENELNSQAEYIVASESGMVSYKVDGFENVLTTTDFSKLNKAFLENLNLNTDEIIASSSSTCKIVNNYNSYLVFNSVSNESKNAKIGDKITIRIQNTTEVTATIENIIEETDGSRTIAIEIKKEVENLIEYRKISFDIIWWSANGFRIPNSAIKEINGINYVVRNRNGYLNKMPVKILKQSGDYSIVSSYTRSELLELGLSSDDISNLKTITLYDRIQMNPTL